jgi:hypothetical protein
VPPKDLRSFIYFRLHYLWPNRAHPRFISCWGRR